VILIGSRDAMTSAPRACAICTPATPTPPVAPETSTRSRRREVSLTHQGVVGGREGFGESARLFPAHLFGRKRRCFTRHETVSRLCPPPTIAPTRRPSKWFDDTFRRPPRPRPRVPCRAASGGAPAGGGVKAQALHEVGGVHAGRAHRDHDVPRDPAGGVSRSSISSAPL